MFYTQMAATSDYQWKPGKAYETAEQAEQAARRLHAMRKASVDIVQLAGKTGRKYHTKYIATVLSDALGRVWTQVSVEGGMFL